jgi:hypothetical protein
MPVLLQTLALRDAMITTNTMGHSAKPQHDRGPEDSYICALKSNQPSVVQAVNPSFKATDAGVYRHTQHDSCWTGIMSASRRSTA